MDPKIELLLQMMSQPVFLVKDGIVRWHNDPADCLVSDGMEIRVFLNEGAKLYYLWDRKGPMQMTISVFGIKYEAKVRIIEEGELFVLEILEEDRYEGGSTLSQISSGMRRIMQELISSVAALQDQMFENPELTKETELLNRSVYRLIRLCTQISDGGNLMQNRPQSMFESLNVHDFLYDFADEAGSLLRESGWDLKYKPCKDNLTAYFDPELIERALYNLVSTGIRHSKPGHPVMIEAWEEPGLVCFCVSYQANRGCLGGFFSSFGDAYGKAFRLDGLGADVVRLIAELHGGSVLSSVSEEEEKVETVLTVKRFGKNIGLRSPGTFHRRAESFHGGLVELSEVLDPGVYHPDKV